MGVTITALSLHSATEKIPTSKIQKPQHYPSERDAYFCETEIASLLYNSEITANSEQRATSAPTGNFLPPQNRSALCGHTFAQGEGKRCRLCHSDITLIKSTTSECFLHFNLHLVGCRRMRLCPFLVSEVEQEIYSA